MKAIYTIAFFLCLGTFAQAQQEVVSACNLPDGGVQITFDYSQNCPASPGSLAGLANIGFHSGVNGWSNVVDWDAATAVNGVNDGSDIFTVTLTDPTTYYGVAPTEYNFVFNQGPANAGAPWDAEGKMDDGTGTACLDFAIPVADITEACLVSVHDLKLTNAIFVAPNPFTERAVINIDNANAEVFTITLSTLAGQTVRQVTGFNGTQYELERGDLSAGMYFITFQNAEGKFATEKVVIR